MHTLFDVKTQIPSFVYITTASVNDVNAMDFIPYERGSYYIFDRGYNDFERLHRIQHLEAYFVLRARDNLQFNRMYSNKVDKEAGVKCDHVLATAPGGFKISPYMQEHLCRAGTKMTFEEASEEIIQLAGLEVNAKQIERLCHHYGESLGQVDWTLQLCRASGQA